MEIFHERINAPEISNIWTHYIRETMSVCVNHHVLKTTKDEEVKAIFEFALQLSKNHIEQLIDIMNKDQFPIPIGFHEEDVNLNAPALFSDIFWLKYLLEMDIHGQSGFAISLSTSTRPDIRQFYYHCNVDSMNLYNKVVELLVKKGVYDRPPHISIPSKIEFIKDQSFIKGLFGERRPLNVVEINSLYFNLRKSVLTNALLLGFSQIASEREVSKILLRMVEIKQKHIEIFSSVLNEDNIISPTQLNSDITNSTTPIFSDKLMVYHTGFLYRIAIGYYGTALALMMRTDLVVHLERTIMEDLKVLEDLSNISIKNGWMEQPPQAEDRKALALNKK